MKKTWEVNDSLHQGLVPKSKSMYDELEKLTDPGRNMKKYRDRLVICTPPIVPFVRSFLFYLAIYLKDLTFINDGNPSRINDLYNFEKCRMLYSRVNDIALLAKVEYNFPDIPSLQNFLKTPKIEKSLTKLKEMSVLCEK